MKFVAEKIHFAIDTGGKIIYNRFCVKRPDSSDGRAVD